MKACRLALIASFALAIGSFAAEPERKGIDFGEARKFWSFQPVTKHEPPAVKDSTWARTPIDRFILAKLEEKGLRPVACAERRALIRRATFDLTGLPPTPEEVAAFLKESEAKPQAAYEALIDRLLASPHYGEAQARHWLDVARYAEDQAHTFAVVPNTNAYRYRDWVIAAFNQDMPYDRFVKLQIAADLLDDGSPEMAPHKAALGFFGLGAQYYKNSDAAKAAADELDDRVDTLTRGFLGLTVSCARCHDHKFDPIPTQDYYSIAGIFWSCKLANVPLASKAEIDRFQKNQKEVQAADQKVKDLVQAEKDRLIKVKAEDLPAYFLASWKLEAKRMEKPGTTAAEQAKLDKIDAAALDRLTKFMSRKGPSVAALEGWRKNLPKAGTKPEPAADVVKAAEALRDYVKSAVGTANDKPKTEMLRALFGDKGVFPITDAEAIGKMTPECKQQFESARKVHAEIAKAAPAAPPMAHGIADANPVDLRVYIRGNPAKQGDLAPRRFLRIVAGDSPAAFKKGSGRLELAEAIADAKNPLTARVMVNRIWQHHFGRGIVGTPSNFGNLGERPTHPELLDYLASRFIASGWSIKRLQREIMLSAAYQSSSERDPKAMEVDADNRLLWRMSRQRLAVESWRDAMLAVSSKLDRKLGGPTANLDNPEYARRTIYAKVSRHELNGFLRLFDFPDANITADRRSETTVPQQQLFVLNSAFMINQAKALAGRLQKEAATDGERIQRAYLLAFGRPPTSDETDVGLRYLGAKDPAEADGRNKLTRWERYAQALLASNEFMYID
jgi:hypothetical protein